MFKNKEYKIFMETSFQSSARIVSPTLVEVTALDGEIFYIISHIGKHVNKEMKNYELHIIEGIFDKQFSEDKEEMANNIWRFCMINGISFMGMSPGNRQNERFRIGARIREIREERGIEARDLAKVAGIDAANLSKIENGKHSVGIDILSKIAAALGKKIDLVDI